MRKIAAILALIMMLALTTACDDSWGCDPGYHAETTTEYTYHYGFSYRGKWEFFYGPETKTICVADNAS